MSSLLASAPSYLPPSFFSNPSTDPLSAELLGSDLPGPGLLPSWMLFVSALSIFNTAQVYTSTVLSKRVYAGKPYEGPLCHSSSSSLGVSVGLAPLPCCVASSKPPSQKAKATYLRWFRNSVTPLSARTFGTWTILAALVRTYAALNISSPESVLFPLSALFITRSCRLTLTFFVSRAQQTV